MKKAKILVVAALIAAVMALAAGCGEAGTQEKKPDLYDIKFTFTGETSPLGWLQKYGHSNQSGGDYDLTLEKVVEKYIPQTDWGMTYTAWQVELKQLGKEELIANDWYDFSSAADLQTYLDKHVVNLYKELTGVSFTFGNGDATFPLTVSVPGKEDITYTMRNLAGGYMVSFGEGLEEHRLNFALHYYAQSDWIFDFSIPYSVLGAGDEESEAYSAPLHFSLKDANYKTLCSISVRPRASYKETAENSSA